MSTFFMFGRYTADALKGASAARTVRGVELIQDCGGEVKSMHALLGERDLCFVVDFPSNEEALRASLGLTRLTGISFVTSPAVTVEELDRIANQTFQD